MNEKKAKALYRGRRLAEGFPDLEAQGAVFFAEHQGTNSEALQVMQYIDRLADVRSGKPVVVLGCGPKPDTLAKIVQCGFNAVGVEPIAALVEAANRWLDGRGQVLQGQAESLPFADSSCSMVIAESVLEHVESPHMALAEAYRVLAPGGVLYLYTTNRLRFSVSGRNGEFNVPFFNWLPAVVKESYVHHHLHFDPRLANLSPRPAVHWFTYAELCKLGRWAGFSQFYAKLDLLEPGDPAASSWLRRTFLKWFKYRPWLRSLALVHYGNSIFMVKRAAPGEIAA